MQHWPSIEKHMYIYWKELHYVMNHQLKMYLIMKYKDCQQSSVSLILLVTHHTPSKGFNRTAFFPFSLTQFVLLHFFSCTSALWLLFCRCSLHGSGACRPGSVPSVHGSVWAERVIVAIHCQELLIHPLHSLTSHQTLQSNFLVCIQTLFSLSPLYRFDQFNKFKSSLHT